MSFWCNLRDFCPSIETVYATTTFESYIVKYIIKGVVHFQKKTVADNLLTPMPSKMSVSFFRQSKRN